MYATGCSKKISDKYEYYNKSGNVEDDQVLKQHEK